MNWDNSDEKVHSKSAHTKLIARMPAIVDQKSSLPSLRKLKATAPQPTSSNISKWSSCLSFICVRTTCSLRQTHASLAFDKHSFTNLEDSSSSQSVKLAGTMKAPAAMQWQNPQSPSVQRSHDQST